MKQFEEKMLLATVATVKKHTVEENIVRIKKCLSHLTEAEIWQRPNENVVSVGNLVLHLCGNVRQWLISGMSNAPDHRNRAYEFEETGPLPVAHLLTELDRLAVEVSDTLELLTPEDLLRKKTVQGIFEETGIGILIHVTEHFSYHTGQITWWVKTQKNIDLKYYGGLDLDS